MKEMNNKVKGSAQSASKGVTTKPSSDKLSQKSKAPIKGSYHVGKDEKAGEGKRADESKMAKMVHAGEDQKKVAKSTKSNEKISQQKEIKTSHPEKTKPPVKKLETKKLTRDAAGGEWIVAGKGKKQTKAEAEAEKLDAKKNQIEPRVRKDSANKASAAITGKPFKAAPHAEKPATPIAIVSPTPQRPPPQRLVGIVAPLNPTSKPPPVPTLPPLRATEVPVGIPRNLGVTTPSGWGSLKTELPIIVNDGEWPTTPPRRNSIGYTLFPEGPTKMPSIGNKLLEEANSGANASNCYSAIVEKKVIEQETTTSPVEPVQVDAATVKASPNPTIPVNTFAQFLKATHFSIYLHTDRIHPLDS